VCCTSGFQGICQDGELCEAGRDVRTRGSVLLQKRAEATRIDVSTVDDESDDNVDVVPTRLHETTRKSTGGVTGSGSDEHDYDMRGPAVGSPDDKGVIVSYKVVTGDVRIPMREAFHMLDKDKSGALNAFEVHHGFFSAKAMEAAQSAHVNATPSSVAVSMAEAKSFVSEHDTDNSGDLSMHEFLASIEGEQTANSSQLVQLAGVEKCVSSVFEQVWKTMTCAREVEVKECFRSWKVWEWVTECVTKIATQLYECGKHVAKLASQVITSFPDCLNSIISEVKGAAASGHSAFMDLLPDDCQSMDWDGIDSCKSKLEAGPKKLLSLLGDELKQQAISVIQPLMPGLAWAGPFLDKIQPTAKTLGSVMLRSGAAIVKFTVNSGKAIVKYANGLPDICAKDGMGFWKIAPTDCGAFDEMKKIFTESFKVWKIHERFDGTVKKFGKCIAKLGVLSLPSPFMDIPVQSFCLPQVIQIPIKGIVGSFQYMIAQTKAAINGCQGMKKVWDYPCSSAVCLDDGKFQKTGDVYRVGDKCYEALDHCWGCLAQGASKYPASLKLVTCPDADEQPVCELARDIKEVGMKLKELFTGGGSLLEFASNSSMGLGGKSEGKSYRADCSGSDFAVNFDIGTGVVFPLGAGMISPLIFFQATSGCRKSKAFFDFNFGLGLDRGVLGKPKAVAKQIFVKVGFSIGTPPKKVFSAGAAIKFALAVDLKTILPALPVKVGAVLGFNILPKMKTPRGFTIVVKGAIAANLLQEEAGLGLAEGVQRAVDQADGINEKVLAGIATFAKTLAKGGDLSKWVHPEVPEPSALLQHGIKAMAGYQRQGAHSAMTSDRDSIVDVNCLAGLLFKFCLTCLPGVRAAVPALASAVSTPKVEGLIYDYPACLPGCLNGHYQLKGSIYRISGLCFKAMDNCWGCLAKANHHPKSLLSVPCVSSATTVWRFPSCKPHCLDSGKYQKAGDVYRVGDKCYAALTKCYGCLRSPSHYPAELSLVACPDKGVTYYDYPACSSYCLVSGKFQVPGVAYRVGGSCYRAVTGCWGCLPNPTHHPDQLQKLPCN